MVYDAADKSFESYSKKTNGHFSGRPDRFFLFWLSLSDEFFL